jgi:peroxiredoxin (alkyl hydroperoxide reductase subunit C)
MVAFVQRPAPTFVAPAVIGGTFEDIDLASYHGQW